MIVTSSHTSSSSKPPSLPTKTCFLFYLYPSSTILACVAFHWNMISLPGGVTHKTESSSPSSCQLPIASCLWVELHIYPLLHAGLDIRQICLRRRNLSKKITMVPVHFCPHSFLKVTEQRILIAFPFHLPQGLSGRIPSVIALKTGESWEYSPVYCTSVLLCPSYTFSHSTSVS